MIISDHDSSQCRLNDLFKKLSIFNGSFRIMNYIKSDLMKCKGQEVCLLVSKRVYHVYQRLSLHHYQIKNMNINHFFFVKLSPIEYLCISYWNKFKEPSLVS